MASQVRKYPLLLLFVFGFYQMRLSSSSTKVVATFCDVCGNFGVLSFRCLLIAYLIGACTRVLAQPDSPRISEIGLPIVTPSSSREIVFSDDDSAMSARFVDLGEQKTGEVSEFDLTLKNATTETIRIVGVKPQCGCTTIVSVPPPILAGNSATMVVAIEPTRPYAPRPQYRLELMIDGRERPVVILMNGSISDAISFKGGPEPLFRIPPTWEADTKNQTVRFELELEVGTKVDLSKLSVAGSPDIPFIRWEIQQRGEKVYVHGECNSADVPPDTTRGAIYVKDKNDSTEMDSTPIAEITIPIRIINPPPVTLLPASILFERSEKAGEWLGNGLVRIDPLVLTDTNASPEFILASPESGKLTAKRLGKLLYSVEIQLMESKKADESKVMLSSEFTVNVLISGKAFRLTGKVR